MDNPILLAWLRRCGRSSGPIIDQTTHFAMRMLSSLALFSLLVCGGTGCLARQVAADGRNFRQSLLDMYTDQVMDNLIRAAENKPFVHLTYRNLTVTDTQIVKANFGTELDPTTAKSVVQQTAALISTMHTFTTKVFFGGSSERDRQMQFQADPETGKADTYDYYVAFAHDPGLFGVSATEPCGRVHIKKRCGQKWYFVPHEAGGVFLELAMKTTFMRGTEAPPTIYWNTNVAKVDPQYSVKGDPVPGRHVIYFTAPIPSDFGFGTLSLDDGRTLKIELRPFDNGPYRPSTELTQEEKDKKQPQPSGVERGKMTDALYAIDNPDLPIVHGSAAADKGIAADRLQGRPIQVFAESYPYLIVPKSPDAQRLQDALDNYRKVLKFQGR
ncbi:MAG TPA: hypothetical protein VFE62_29185 [Gemmataceae bacterium]|nr:hypothetical protein [Gemmataceae bacterium]